MTKPATITRLATKSAICNGPDQVDEFIALHAGKFKQLHSMNSCPSWPFAVPKPGQAVAASRVVAGPDGKPQAVSQQDMVPVFLVNLIGTMEVQVAPESQPGDRVETPADGG